MNASEEGWSVRELAEFAGTTVRTIHYYISEGLMPPPEGATRRATYSPAHLARLRLIGALRDEGLSLASIRQRLAPLTDQQAMDVASELDRYQLQSETTSWTTLGLIEAALASQNEGDDGNERDNASITSQFDRTFPSVPTRLYSSALEIDGVNFVADLSEGQQSSQVRESASEYLKRVRRSSPPRPDQPSPMSRVRFSHAKPMVDDDRPVAWYQFQIDDGIELRVREDRYRESKGRLRAVVDTLRKTLRRYGLSGPPINEE